MLSLVEHEKKFYNFGARLRLVFSVEVGLKV